MKDIEFKVLKYVKERTAEIDKLVNKFYSNHISGNKKLFALTYNKDINFSFAMNVINGHDLFETLKKYLLRKTYHLGDAQEFLKNI